MTPRGPNSELELEADLDTPRTPRTPRLHRHRHRHHQHSSTSHSQLTLSATALDGQSGTGTGLSGLSGEDTTPRLLAAPLDGSLLAPSTSTRSTRAPAAPGSRSVGAFGARSLASGGMSAGAAVEARGRLTEGAAPPPTALLLARAGLLESSSIVSEAYDKTASHCLNALITVVRGGYNLDFIVDFWVQTGWACALANRAIRAHAQRSSSSASSTCRFRTARAAPVRTPSCEHRANLIARALTPLSKSLN